TQILFNSIIFNYDCIFFFFFFQAEDGIRDKLVTGVKTCALPICLRAHRVDRGSGGADEDDSRLLAFLGERGILGEEAVTGVDRQIGRASCRERGWMSEGEGALKEKKDVTG